IPSAPSQFNRVLASLEQSLRHAEELDLAGLLDRAKTLVDAGNRLAGNVNQVDFKQLGTNAASLLSNFAKPPAAFKKHSPTRKRPSTAPICQVSVATPPHWRPNFPAPRWNCVMF